MSMKARRILSWLLVFVMALSMFPSGAFAMEADEPEEIGASSADEAPSEMDSGRNDGPLDESGGEPCRYTLHLTHTLRWKTQEGKGRFTQESETVQLTEEDFAGGGYGLLQLAYDHEALEAAPAPGYPEVLMPEDFWDDGKGGKEGAAEIRYTLLEGWSLRFREDDAPSEGPSFRGQYEGPFDQVEFIPARSITVTIHYEYSRTGGMAGMPAHAPDVIKLILDEEGKADLVNWRVPHYEEGGQEYHDHSHENLRGFRIVLRPAPLDAFLKNPPAENATPEELADALNNGDFNLRSDVDIDGEDYQRAWDAAREFTTEDGVRFTYIAPTENGGTTETTSDDPEAQYTLCAEGLTQDVELTVYFRRDTGSYTVNHWKPKPGVSDPDQERPDDWEPVKESETIPGRNGALTAAVPLDTAVVGSEVFSYRALPFSQEAIKADGTTAVNIYYVPEAIRVIFDTDSIYIRRQLVPPEGTVDLTSPSAIGQTDLNKVKAGYSFGGWQYKDTDGNLVDVPKDGNGNLQLTQAFLEGTLPEGSTDDATGVRVLRLYPKWNKAKTTIRVTLWTEDLDGKNDLTVQDTFYDFDNRREDPGEPSREIIHQDPEGGSFTNVGSFEMKDVFNTGDPLVETVDLDGDGRSEEVLVKAIRDAVKENLGMLGTETVIGRDKSEDVAISNFYEQMKDFTILTEVVDPEKGTVSETTEETTAAADGTTQVYVYFARKEYTLEFHYYFLPEQIGESGTGPVRICTNTDGFQEKEYNWPASGSIKPTKTDSTDWNTILLDNTINGGAFKDSKNRELLKDTIPMKTTITAKYGADLREVWPGAEDASDEQNSTHYVLSNNRRVSWTPTAGLHKNLVVGNNANIPGAYSALSAAIMADPSDNATTKTNHLVAFWKNINNNTYRYNYCYEVPDLSAEDLEDCPSIKIFEDPNASESDKRCRNTLYLISTNHEIFQKYGFTDLLTADQLQLNGTADGRLPDAVGDGRAYYVIRIYKNGNEEKYYAVSRQLVAVSARPIEEQNPSARPNLTLVNKQQDHSTKERPNEDTSFEAPCDVYFHYTRDRFTVTYMTSGRSGTEEIGQIELPYGTALSAKKDDDNVSRYNVPLDYQKKAGYYNDIWKTDWDGKEGGDAANLPVCPDRASDGTAEWTFRGWGLSPSGTQIMDWDNAVPLSGNLRLYACWEAPTYLVTFDWDGGSFSEGENAALDKQWIPANRSFSSSGQIPRPFRSGYILTGWEITHEGADKTPAPPMTEFQFEEPIDRNLWVKAQWEPSGIVAISYTVRYLVNGTDTPVRDPKVVSAPFLPGTVVWESPKLPDKEGFADYVPLEQNQSITLETGKENIITFHYTAPPEYYYNVQYVNQITQEPVLISEVTETTGVALWVTPSREHIQELSERGYYLVDDAGEQVVNGAGLQQLVEPSTERNNSATATFYVLPEIYTIEYRNLEEVMGADAAGLDNPTRYTAVSDPLLLNNPTGSYSVDGQTITFQGWTMVETREVGGIRDFPDGTTVSQSVTIATGSRGNLIFRAVWNPEVYGVYFYPGDHGSLSGDQAFTGIPGGTVLEDHTGFAVPTATPEEGYTFTGWELEEDGKIYTAAEIRLMEIGSQDLHFTARYSKKAPTPPDRPDDPPAPPTPTPDPEPAPEPTPPEPAVPPLIERPVDPSTGMVPYDPTVILDDLVPLAAPHLNITDHFAYIAGYPTKDVRPEGDITRAEVATIFFRLMLDAYRTENWATENSFSDVSSHDWFNNAVSTCARAGIIKGYEDGTFRPNATITRAEFAAIAARFVSEDVPGYDYFTDMDGHWAQVAVARAVMAGWIRGDGRLFRPEDHLNRAETAALVNRMINRFPDKEHLLPDMIRWPDNPEDAWYYEDIQEASNSHDYDMLEFAFSEIWVTLLPNRDWAALEKEWADASAAPGGEVAPELQPNGWSGDESQDIAK